MAVGVYVTADDVDVVESLTLALERSDGVFVAPALDQAHVVLAPASALARIDAPDGCARIALALRDPIASARAAVACGADGILAWPDERDSLAAHVLETAARTASARAGGGSVVAVVGARGGCGATLLAAHLAAELAPNAALIDVRGGAHGQALFARGPVAQRCRRRRGC